MLLCVETWGKFIIISAKMFSQISISRVRKHQIRRDSVAYTCNPSTLGGRGGWITRSRDRHHHGQHGETPSLLKIQKMSWAWWRVPVIPATREAEAGELPEPRRQRLQWTEIASLHSSPGDRPRFHLKKKKSSFGPVMGWSDSGKTHQWMLTPGWSLAIHTVSQCLPEKYPLQR